MDLSPETLCSEGRKTFLKTGFALFAATGIPFALSFLIRDFFLNRSPMDGYIDYRLVRWIVYFLPIYGVGIPLCLWRLWKLPKTEGDKKKISVGSFLIAFIMCFPMLVGGDLLGNFLAHILTGGRSVNNVVAIISQQDLLTTLTAVILAPVLEELTFRKFLIDHTVQYGEKNAILFSALAFGLFHCNLYQFFYAFGIGLMFGYLYVRTRQVKYTMLMHFLINFMSGVIGAWLISLADPRILKMMEAADTEAMMKLLEEYPQVMFSLYASLIPLMLQNLLMYGLAISGVVLLCVHRKKFLFESLPQELPAGQRFRVTYLNWGVMAFFVLCILETVYVLVQTCV